MEKHFDIIVIGAGHAGVEASLAAARTGMRTLVLTINLDNIALMPCNPSIGGSAKGHLVREIDALGGQMGLTIDSTLMQIRVLNKKKGPAIQAFRAQADKVMYQAKMKQVLEAESNLFLRQGVVTEILEKNDQVVGVRTNTDQEYYGSAVIITTGTFLNGVCHIGSTQIRAGRIGEPPSVKLSASIEKFGIEKGRLKTGTPPRILDRSIDFRSLEKEVGDYPMPHFSYLTDKIETEQVDCYMTHTCENTREIMMENLHLSPLFSGQIEGIGPRYCPSIEDKYKKFPDKKSHLLYLEPESRFNHEVYLQGFSTSLPQAVQIQLVKSIPGLENSFMLRPGYAVEYDFFNPIQLYPSLESKVIENLYFAGQINGTSGYEEAGAQGIIAGLNASLKLQKKDPLDINRSNSYMGVLIHDLVTKGTKEPYRMFSSLVEHRTYIRHDNADARLTPLGFQAGLASKERHKGLQRKNQGIVKIRDYLKQTGVTYNFLKQSGIQTSSFQDKKKLEEILRRPELNLTSIRDIHTELDNLCSFYCSETLKEVEVQVKYEGYIRKQEIKLEERKRLSYLKIPKNFNYTMIRALSNEGREKLEEVRPLDVSQAGLISGIRQSDLALLISYLKRSEL